MPAKNQRKRNKRPLEESRNGLETIMTYMYRMVLSQAREALSTQLLHKQQYLQHLPNYLTGAVGLSLSTQTPTQMPDIGAELERYEQSIGMRPSCVIWTSER